MPCSKCQIPYEGYGCLRQRREVTMACILDCDILLPDHMAQTKCLETCHNAKSLHFL
ncbi:hypothetical protein V3C99_007083 [Haemonchus contortus]